MTRETMLSLLESMSGVNEKDKPLLEAYLDLAGEKILNRCYPFGQQAGTAVPEKYHSLQLEIACYLINKRGAEGQSSHGENGINRTYESGSVPDSMLKAVTPYLSVFAVTKTEEGTP